MKLSTLNFLLASLLPTITAAALPSSVQTVYDDITLIDVNVRKLTATTAKYDGGYIGLVPVGLNFTPVYLATRKGYYDSLLLPAKLTTSEAQSLIDHVNKTLSIDNPIAVDTLESKKPLLQPKGLDPFVESGLQLLLSAHLSFSDEVAKRIPEAQQAEAAKVIHVITVALEDGITDFSD